MRKSAYKAGKTIIREGDKGTEAYIIVDGQVEVFRKAKDGSEIILTKLGNNQMFGEICLIDDTMSRCASVRAITDVVVAVITKESFIEKIQSTPTPVRSILKIMAKRIAESNEMFISLYSQINAMVRDKVGEILDNNKILIDQLKEKDELIAELQEEIKKLQESGPTKAPPVKDTRQKLDKDRSMKLSLKDLDNIAKEQQKKKE
ncbi:MAG: cyclic nucleotide-binding domain-containing protein [Cyanobacteriota bacterium]